MAARWPQGNYFNKIKFNDHNFGEHIKTLDIHVNE